MKADARDLIHHVALLTVTVTSGTEVESTSPLVGLVEADATVSARVDELRGSERVASAQVGAVVSHKVLIRYRTDVTPRIRLRWVERGLVLMVHAVYDPDGGRRWLVAECSARV